jgi:hypothetical protein
MHSAPDTIFRTLADPIRRATFERRANYGWQKYLAGLERVAAGL